MSPSKLEDEEQKKRGVFQVHGIYPMPVIMKTNVNKQTKSKQGGISMKKVFFRLVQ